MHPELSTGVDNFRCVNVIFIDKTRSELCRPKQFLSFRKKESSAAGSNTRCRQSIQATARFSPPPVVICLFSVVKNNSERIAIPRAQGADAVAEIGAVVAARAAHRSMMY